MTCSVLSRSTVETCLVPLVLLWAGACEGNELGHLAAPGGGDMTHAPAPRAPFDTRQVAACGRGELTEAGLAALVRRPYLQKVTHDSAEILWTSESTDEVVVQVTRPGGELIATSTAEVDGSATPVRGTQFVARVTGLDPDATLCYRIIGSAAWTQPIGFRTAPAPGDTTAPVRLVAFGDVGTRTSDQFAVLAELATVEFDFALIAGDIAYNDGTRAELENNFFGVYRALMARTTFYPASGNHDYHTSDAAAFREGFALFEHDVEEGRERWYSFDWGSVHVVVLDTEKLGPAQTQWLERDLAATSLPWIIAIAHKPPYSSGAHGSDSAVEAAFVPLFETYGVDIAFFGHEHNYERTRPIGGVVHVITGGAGRGTRSVGTSDFTAFSAQVAHFVYVTVEDPILRLYAIDATGRDFDTLELVREN